MLVKPSQIWSNLVKHGQTCYKLVLFGAGHYKCPVVELSYMGYSPPKCTCNGNQTYSSKTCKFLLKCLHDMNENVTHPLPCLEFSLAPSHMPKPRVRTHYFQNKMFLFSKTYYRVSVKSIGQPSEVNCWVIL